MVKRSDFEYQLLDKEKKLIIDRQLLKIEFSLEMSLIGYHQTRNNKMHTSAVKGIEKRLN